jgi:3-hydroxyisobutyrate dehydrogenase-like beta-hydroxyacid dehydrogenase
VAEYSDVVLACLPNVAASLGVFLGPDGLIASGRAGQVFADHSTVDPATSRRIYAAARERGIDFLDAPISGGPEGAKAATLSILVGGGASAFERARQVFAALGKTVVHLGPSGAGTVAKLANQLLVGVHTLASCEALAMARKAGVDIEQLLFVLSRSWGASRMLERNGPYIAERRFDSTGSPLRNLLKDLALVAALGEELGLNLRAASSARDVFAELAQLGWGERDITAAAMLVDGQSRTSTCREP